MKKKFVLTLALVLMVAASLMAATPVEVSGDFYAGYVLNFNPNSITDDKGTGAEGEIYNVTFKGDFFEVKFSDLKFTDAQDTAATATVFVDKALAAEGVDMGDVTLKYAIGNMTTLKPSDVYSDSNDKVAELEMISTYPTKITLGYAGKVTVEVGLDVASFDNADKPILLGATFAPVDGVKAAVGYTNVTAGGNKGGMTASALVDVKALADLDFDLTASAITVFDFNTKKNKLYVEAKTSIEDIAAWAEYQLIDTTSNVAAKVTYSGIENVGVYAKVALADLSNVTTTIEAGADYTLGGVTYALDAAYVVNGAFSLTPSVSISF